MIGGTDVVITSVSQEPHSFVDNAHQLVELFLFYFARGSSAERCVIFLSYIIRRYSYFVGTSQLKTSSHPSSLLLVNHQRLNGH